MYKWLLTVMLAQCCLARVAEMGMADTVRTALAFSAPRFPYGLRYPVGYNPDNRTRPNYYPTELLIPDKSDTPEMPENFNRCSDNTCAPMELKERPRWVPPEAYNPKRRRSTGTAFQTSPLQRTDEDKAVNSNVYTDPEHVNWENDYDADDKIRLCTGIWMGRKILHKRCVTLDQNDPPEDEDSWGV